MWLRRDLRLYDHTALSLAAQESEALALVFVFDTRILKSLSPQDRRLSFIFESLQEIDQNLRQRGSRLVVLQGDPVEEIPRLAQKLSVQALYTHNDYEPKAKVRDQKIRAQLKKQGCLLVSLKDQVIFEKAQILNSSQQAFKVFTPYLRVWQKTLRPADYGDHSAARLSLLPSRLLDSHSESLVLKNFGFSKTHLWLGAGESAGRRRLKSFMTDIAGYKQNRDFPAAEATSGLSVHLRFGTVSIRDALRQALNHPSEGSRTWIKELVWRDFYQMILDQYPHVENSSFRPEYAKINWPGKTAHFRAWCEGRTGFPLMDAAMIHFNQTGWMHNRLRMIVASFLAKDLLISWQEGEKYFADGLLDFDLAANNGGWQWCASTGCDAQPYFRIFNPESQSKKFDPDQEFINQHVKKPTKPIVDHGTQRSLALALYREAQLRR